MPRDGRRPLCLWSYTQINHLDLGASTRRHSGSVLAYHHGRKTNQRSRRCLFKLKLLSISAAQRVVTWAHCCWLRNYLLAMLVATAVWKQSLMQWCSHLKYIDMKNGNAYLFICSLLGYNNGEMICDIMPAYAKLEQNGALLWLPCRILFTLPTCSWLVVASNHKPPRWPGTEKQLLLPNSCNNTRKASC